MIEFKFSAAKLQGWMATTPREIRAGCIRALRRTGTAVQGTAVDLFRQRGIGRTVFGKKASGARKLIRRSKLRVTEGVLEQPITVIGMAAIQERGGRFKPHVIVPKNRKALRFGVAGAFGFGGDAVFSRGEVQHPGASHPAMPFLAQAAARNMTKFRQEVDAELAKAVGKRVA